MVTRVYIDVYDYHWQVDEWPLSEAGLLYDRNWSIVDSRGQCLTLKRHVELRNIKPSIDLDKGKLILCAEG